MEADLKGLVKTAVSLNNTQEYFMMVAKTYGEVTVTYKNEPPYVTIFLGKGPEAPIGLGNSVAEAILEIMHQGRLPETKLVHTKTDCSCGQAH